MAKKNGKNGNNHNPKKIEESFSKTIIRTCFLLFIGIIIYTLINIHFKNLYNSDFCLFGFGIIMAFSILSGIFLRNLCKIKKCWIVPFIIFIIFFFILGLWHIWHAATHPNITNVHVAFWMTVAFFFLIATIIKQCIYEVKRK